MRKAFAKSIKNAPTKETTSHARGDGPCLPAKDNMLTNAFGVAPRPSRWHQRQHNSIVVATKDKVDKVCKYTDKCTLCYLKIVINGNARSIN